MGLPCVVHTVTAASTSCRAVLGVGTALDCAGEGPVALGAARAVISTPKSSAQNSAGEQC